jgi:hypothetical protein
MMKYLGIARNQNGRVVMPDTFEAKDGVEYEAVDMGGDILLMPSTLQRERIKLIKRLTEITIKEHGESLKGLAK